MRECGWNMVGIWSAYGWNMVRTCLQILFKSLQACSDHIPTICRPYSKHILDRTLILKLSKFSSKITYPSPPNHQINISRKFNVSAWRWVGSRACIFFGSNIFIFIFYDTYAVCRVQGGRRNAVRARRNLF